MPLSPPCRRAWSIYFDDMKNPAAIRQLDAYLMAEELPEGCPVRDDLNAELAVADTRLQDTMQRLAQEFHPPFPDYYYRRVEAAQERHASDIDRAWTRFRLAMRDLLWSS